MIFSKNEHFEIILINLNNITILMKRRVKIKL